MTRRQHGFTLVEIAIVLVIIGLLLGGILKGQELINSARVRNIADTNSGVQAAYYGFVDRYRAVPGDMIKTAAATAIGTTINSGGNGNGRLDSFSGSGGDEWQEAAALWEHLWKAGFIQGSYNGVDSSNAVPTDEATYREAGSPVNPFNGSMILFRTADYQTEPAPAPAASTRLNLVMGRQIPVNIARELDTKLDDARPLTGVVRLVTASGVTFSGIGDYNNSPDCKTATGNDYDIAGDSQDCNVLYLY